MPLPTTRVGRSERPIPRLGPGALPNGDPTGPGRISSSRPVGLMSGRGTDFFVSHAGRDTAWAEWLGWQLQQAGYTVELDVWDWVPGEDFVARMAVALEQADRLLAVCSEAYFASAFGSAELRAAFAHQTAAEGWIVPVLVEPVRLPALFAPLIPLDLTGLEEDAAVARLRDRLAGGAQPPRRRPPSGRGRGVGARGSSAGHPPSGRFRRAIRTSPAATACLPSCAAGCAPERTRWWCRRSTDWAGWARPSWRSSTPTGSPPTTTWSGGSTPSSRRSSASSSPPWPPG